MENNEPFQPPQSDEQTSSEEEEVRSTIRKGKRRATDIAERVNIFKNIKTIKKS